MRLVMTGIFALLMTTSLWAGTALIPSSRDATLIEDPNGALANGSGPSFFVGRTSQEVNNIRRAVIYFDVASALQEPAVIEEVSVRLYLSPSNPGPREIRLHRVQASWGEGPSSSAGGGGAPSQPGDVTWLHTFFDQELWVVPGGQFVERASASRTVDGSGFYTWEGTNHLVQDVQLWLAAPGRNFGWILIGDETQPQTAQNFASRENPDSSLRPLLTVRYTLPAGEGAKIVMIDRPSSR